MIFVWSGFGFLAVVLAFVGGLGGLALQMVISGVAPGLPVTTGLAIGLVLAAAANWFIGVRLNGRPGRELIDAKTGQRVVFRRRHSLFWIPMQYMSALLVVAAVFVLFVPKEAPRELLPDARGALKS